MAEHRTHLAGLDRFVQHRYAAALQLLAALVAAIGSDHHHRQRLVEASAHREHDVPAGQPVIQMVIGEDRIRHDSIQRRHCALLVGGGHHRAAPLFEQDSHAEQDALLIVDHQQAPPRQRIAQLRHDHRSRNPLAGHRLGQWHVDTEHRAAPRLRSHQHRVVEHAGDSVDDGQPQPYSTAFRGSTDPELIELEEDRLQLLLRNAPPGVPNLDTQRPGAYARTHQDATPIGITAGIAEKITQDSRQQAEIGFDGETRDVVLQLQPCGSSDRLEFRHQRQQDIVKRVDVDIRFDRGLIELGDVEQIGQQVFGAFQGLVGPLDQMQLVLRQFAFAQGRDQQARGVERLQQVVAGCGEVLVLAQVGGFRRIAGFTQFTGALSDALLELFVELQQAQLRQFALGNVGDEAFHQSVFVRLEQQVHDHVDGAAVLAAQARLVAEQAMLLAQDMADLPKLLLTADE